jgi:hypothetical protein
MLGDQVGYFNVIWARETQEKRSVVKKEKVITKHCNPVPLHVQKVQNNANLILLHLTTLIIFGEKQEL